jgi:hypothetical protein
VKIMVTPLEKIFTDSFPTAAPPYPINGWNYTAPTVPSGVVIQGSPNNRIYISTPLSLSGNQILGSELLIRNSVSLTTLPRFSSMKLISNGGSLDIPASGTNASWNYIPLMGAQFPINYNGKPLRICTAFGEITNNMFGLYVFVTYFDGVNWQTITACGSSISGLGLSSAVYTLWDLEIKKEFNGSVWELKVRTRIDYIYNSVPYSYDTGYVVVPGLPFPVEEIPSPESLSVGIGVPRNLDADKFWFDYSVNPQSPAVGFPGMILYINDVTEIVYQHRFKDNIIVEEKEALKAVI